MMQCHIGNRRSQEGVQRNDVDDESEIESVLLAEEEEDNKAEGVALE